LRLQKPLQIRRRRIRSIELGKGWRDEKCFHGHS
jgi:hypothetical protein